MDKNTRTYLAKTFCQTIQSSGYTPIIYTNVEWATNKLDMSQLSAYDTWLQVIKKVYNLDQGIMENTQCGSIQVQEK